MILTGFAGQVSCAMASAAGGETSAGSRTAGKREAVFMKACPWSRLKESTSYTTRPRSSKAGVCPTRPLPGRVRALALLPRGRRGIRASIMDAVGSRDGREVALELDRL